jgi:flagellar biosynthesis/type III secretory pathway protein FliH
MAPPAFVPLPRQKTAWEPLIREQRPAPEPKAVRPAPRPEAPPADPQKAARDAIRAEFEAKDAARSKEHASALQKLQQQQAELQQQSERLKKLASEMETSRRTMLKQLRTGSGQLILEAARRIAGDGLRAQPELIDQMVVEATEALGSKGLVLHVGPLDAEHLLESLKETGILVETDFVMTGGLRAESPAGRLDASMETALIALSRVIESWQEAGE